VWPVDDETGVLEHLEVLRHGRPADRQVTRQLDDRARTLGDAFEDRAPRGVAEGGESVESVSHC
jgi:hypothetical protein